MKRLRILLLILVLSFINITGIKAKEFIKDGWHLVKPYTGTKYVWGYYENGSEIMRKSQMIFVHRGWSTEPENSMFGFELAKENGYYAIETDVRFTKDNVPVLLHDGRINRITTDEDNNILNYLDPIHVNELTYNELLNYRFNVTSYYDVLEDSKYVNNKITKFEDIVKFAKENKIVLDIELKDGTEEQIASLVSIVKAYDMDNVVIWFSFYPTLLEYVNNVSDSEFLIVGSDYQSELTPQEIYDLLKKDNNHVNVNGTNGIKDILIKGMPIIDLPINMVDEYEPSQYDIEPLGLVQIKKIEIVEEPRNIYYIGDKLDLTAGKVKITYLNDTSEIVSMGSSLISASGFDSNELGTKEITLTCASESVSFNVNVIEKTFNVVYENIADGVMVHVTTNVKFKDTKPSWTLSNNGYTYSKKFTSSRNYKVIFEDIYGIQSSVSLDIKVLELNAKSSYDSLSNTVLISITSNYELKNNKNTWALSDDSKTYSKIYKTNGNYSVIFESLDGIKKEVSFSVSGIESVFVDYINQNDGSVLVKATSSIGFKDTKPSWTLSSDSKTYSKVYSVSQDYDTLFTLKNGNTVKKNIKVNPSINIKYISQSDGSILVKVTSSIGFKDTKPSWTLSSDSKTYSKIYSVSQDYDTLFTLKNGNTVKKNIKVTVSKFELTINYQEVGNVTTVVVKANHKFKNTKPSWTLSADFLTYTKEITSLEPYSTLFEDIYGNKISIKLGA